MKSPIKLSITLVILSLLAQSSFSQTLISPPSNPLTTIAAAKSFLSENAKHNWLLTNIQDDGNFYAFSFEGRRDPIRISKNIVFQYGVDQFDWKAYIIYTDMTRQEIPYLGTNGISAVETTLNPFTRCPLTATFKFDLKAPGKLRLTVVGRDADSFDFVHNFTDTTSHYAKVPVLGLYEGFLNTIVLTILSPDDAIRFEELWC